MTDSAQNVPEMLNPDTVSMLSLPTSDSDISQFCHLSAPLTFVTFNLVVRDTYGYSAGGKWRFQVLTRSNTPKLLGSTLPHGRLTTSTANEADIILMAGLCILSKWCKETDRRQSSWDLHYHTGGLQHPLLMKQT
ncbi:hypothetical protein J6590_033098 [Homalodisca vitripennis]|nr:hypothetical protein J6590_033098 [Homalodisca vitripennis]